MADVQHKDIPDSQIHEPKGIASASANTVYQADGLGSGSWSSAPFDPSNFTIERCVDGKSTAATQDPTGLGQANAIQVEFGPAVNTITDNVQLLADGTLIFNTGGLYRIKITLSYGRTGGAGVSEPRFRALINGVQAGQTIGTEIGSADVIQIFADEAWLEIPEGTQITYEVMRDASGNDSGGLKQVGVDGATAPDWNDATCAAIRVERWVS